LVNSQSASSFEHDFLKISTTSIESSPDALISTRHRPGIENSRKWLESNSTGRWLIIVDDADENNLLFEPHHLLKLIPRNPAGSVLFTTRNKQMALKLVVPENVKVLEALSSIEAQQMLLSYMGQAVFTETETADAAKLLRQLEHLPLAIAQAGSFMCANSMPISEYLRLYNESEASKTIHLGRMMDSEQLRLFNSNTLESSISVALTLMVSVDRIRKEDPQAADLLSFMACFGSQQIPRSLLSSNGISGGRMDLSKALGVLKGYFLIAGNEDDQLFNMNVLVHVVIREWLRAEGTFNFWHQRAFASVYEKFPSAEEDDNNALGLCDLYLIHVEAILDYEQVQTEHAERLRLADRCSRYLAIKGGYTDSVRLARKAAKWGADFFGESHELTLALMSNLGLAAHRLGRYDEAEQIHRNVLQHRKVVLGLEHEETLATMSNITWALQSQGKLSAAKEIGEEVAKMKCRVLGQEHPRTLISLNMYGTILQDLGDLEYAEQILSKVLRIREKQLGHMHPSTLVTKGNFSSLLYEQGKFDAAEKMARQVFEASNEVRGTRHPESIRCLFNLSEIMLQLKRYTEAETFRRQALEARLEILGPEHPDTLSTEESLRQLLKIRLTDVEKTNQADCELLQQDMPPSHGFDAVEEEGDTVSVKCRGDGLRSA
jgi:tetratricopeptide (TPR) repeat protein